MSDLFNGWPEDGEPMSDLLQELRWWYESDPDPRIKRAADEIERLRRGLDNIKIRSYELGQIELHDMALKVLIETCKAEHEQNAKLQAVVDAAKGVTEYGEVAFMGVNIPFKSFRKLKEALASLEDDHG